MPSSEQLEAYRIHLGIEFLPDYYYPPMSEIVRRDKDSRMITTSPDGIEWTEYPYTKSGEICKSIKVSDAAKLPRFSIYCPLCGWWFEGKEYCLCPPKDNANE